MNRDSKNVVGPACKHADYVESQNTMRGPNTLSWYRDNANVYRLIFAAVALVYFCALVPVVSSDALIELNPKVRGLDPNSVKDRFFPETLEIAFNTLKGLVENEDGRFKHVDEKANSFLGMVGIALTVLTTIGAFVSSTKDVVSQSVGYSSNRIAHDLYLILYLMAFAALIFSFLFALLSTQIPNRESANFLGFEVATHYDLDPLIVYGRPYHSQPKEQYMRTLIAEYIEVYKRNYKANGIKANRLSRSQSAAFMAGVALLGIVLILFAEIIIGRTTVKKIR